MLDELFVLDEKSKTKWKSWEKWVNNNNKLYVAKNKNIVWEFFKCACLEMRTLTMWFTMTFWWSWAGVEKRTFSIWGRKKRLQVSQIGLLCVGLWNWNFFSRTFTISYDSVVIRRTSAGISWCHNFPSCQHFRSHIYEGAAAEKLLEATPESTTTTKTKRKGSDWERPSFDPEQKQEFRCFLVFRRQSGFTFNSNAST